MFECPRFLIAQNTIEKPGSMFVLHAHQPRFMVQFKDDSLFKWSPVAVEKFDPITESELKKLMEELGNWYRMYLQYSE